MCVILLTLTGETSVESQRKGQAVNTEGEKGQRIEDRERHEQEEGDGEDRVWVIHCNI